MSSPLPTARFLKSGATILLVAGALSISACSHKKAPQELPPEPGPARTTTTPPSGQPLGPQPGSQADFAAKMMGADTIYFDTDKYDIDAMDQQALAKQAQWLMMYPNKQVTVEGHADERGTREYNLALGERRANSAKNYLVSLGVAPGRITTISYGKERPVALGSNEQAWAQNRRAVTVTID
ncbi:peptidoglycan-associated lipoprotein Pal [Novosphingobium sp. 1949]|uniref:Peptidoglycan-associated protein n=1 Tax=Novosphingobium organovorum TaxID=2930092 RepID=A0ABT0B9M1_9SPHN|nr:peptidoglycan-associated lipoprotein Pal [Novosphingobium organovorum]MCJ2181742.1 peptidoglycan-associated lipoprotein Pal [Novosphingobium organovorum]